MTCLVSFNQFTKLVTTTSGERNTNEIISGFPLHFGEPLSLPHASC